MAAWLLAEGGLTPGARGAALILPSPGPVTMRMVEGTKVMRDALTLHKAYQRGELASLKRLLGDPPDFPNCRGPQGAGEIILEYAIYHSPLAFIRTLLQLGADPNYEDHAGFPSLIAALSSAPGRPLRDH